MSKVTDVDRIRSGCLNRTAKGQKALHSLDASTLEKCVKMNFNKDEIQDELAKISRALAMELNLLFVWRAGFHSWLDTGTCCN